MNYKAVERYYNADGVLVENLCGFGDVKSLEEARREYRPGIIITEITQEELLQLRESVK